MSMKENEVYYKCPHCRGRVKIVLEKNGMLKLFKHEAKDN
jgi:hypothetical protein